MRYGLTKPHIVASAPAASLAVKTTRSSSSSSSSSASASSPSSSSSSSDGGGAAALSGITRTAADAAKGSFSDSGSAASSVDAGGFSSGGRGLGTIQSTPCSGRARGARGVPGKYNKFGSIVNKPFIILLMIAGCFLLAAQ